jgi:hypothetical protein
VLLSIVLVVVVVKEIILLSSWRLSYLLIGGTAFTTLTKDLSAAVPRPILGKMKISAVFLVAALIALSHAARYSKTMELVQRLNICIGEQDQELRDQFRLVLSNKVGWALSPPYKGNDDQVLMDLRANPTHRTTMKQALDDCEHIRAENQKAEILVQRLVEFMNKTDPDSIAQYEFFKTNPSWNVLPMLKDRTKLKNHLRTDAQERTHLESALDQCQEKSDESSL